jgi:intergrase/recombinase
VPTPEAVAQSLRQLPNLMVKHQAGYSLLLDSGLRGVEAERLIVEFDADKAVAVNDFYRYNTGWVRAIKSSFVAYFTEPTFQLLCEAAGSKLGMGDLSNIARKHGLVPAKSLRKFCFGAMLSEELGVPESVADFIEGRTAKKVGARHYTSLVRQADGWYGRYSNYVMQLRTTAWNPKEREPFCRRCGGALTAKEAKANPEFCASCAKQVIQQVA